MRRAPFVLGGTAGGMALLLSYHTSALSITVPQASRPSTTPAAGAPPSPAGTPGQPAPGSDSTTAAGPTTTVPGSSGAPANTAPVAGAPTPTTPSSPPPPAPTTTVGAQTFTGTQVTYQYGVLQLQITDQGGHITNVTEVVDQASDSRSAQINGQAIPRLNQEALQAQSANIQAVSGATYTSNAYVQSLQSAIDQMG
jgi:uncharacterized protein with FMN-binding domain